MLSSTKLAMDIKNCDTNVYKKLHKLKQIISRLRKVLWAYQKQ